MAISAPCTVLAWLLRLTTCQNTKAIFLLPFSLSQCQPQRLDSNRRLWDDGAMVLPLCCLRLPPTAKVTSVKLFIGLAPALSPKVDKPSTSRSRFRRKLCSSQSKASSDHHQGHNEMYREVNNYQVIQVILKGETWCLFLC